MGIEDTDFETSHLQLGRQSDLLQIIVALSIFMGIEGTDFETSHLQLGRQSDLLRNIVGLTNRGIFGALVRRTWAAGMDGQVL